MATRQSERMLFRGVRLLLSLLIVFCLHASAAPRSQSGCGKLATGQVCCGGRASDLDYDRACCRFKDIPQGEEVYISKKLCNKQGETNTAFENCGDAMYDVRYRRCCGASVTYDLASQTCCVGLQNASVFPKGTTCCDGHPLNEGELCCDTDFGKYPIIKRGPRDTRCCVPDNLVNIQTDKSRIETYNTNTEYCHSDGYVVKFQEEEEDHIHDEDRSQDVPAPETKTDSDSDTDYCLEGRVGTENGERLKCCGFNPFRPSAQTCCDGQLYDRPTEDTLCCGDVAFSRGDPDNPCINKYCNGRHFNKHTHQCCGTKLFPSRSDQESCCGTTLIHSDNETCCGGMPIAKNEFSCCSNTMPYKPAIMNCDASKGGVTLKKRKLQKDSVGARLCNESFHTWSESWRAPTDESMLKFRGRVEWCGIRIKAGTAIIPLAPAVALVGGESISSCLEDRVLRLVISLPKECRLRKKQLKKYLRGKTLEVFVRRGQFKCRRASVRMAKKDASLILMFSMMDNLGKGSRL